MCLSCGASQAQLELVNAQTPTPDAEAVQGDQSKLPPARRNSDGVTKEAGDASKKVSGEESHPSGRRYIIQYNTIRWRHGSTHIAGFLVVFFVNNS